MDVRFWGLSGSLWGNIFLRFSVGWGRMFQLVSFVVFSGFVCCVHLSLWMCIWVSAACPCMFCCTKWLLLFCTVSF